MPSASTPPKDAIFSTYDQPYAFEHGGGKPTPKVATPTQGAIFGKNGSRNAFRHDILKPTPQRQQDTIYLVRMKLEMTLHAKLENRRLALRRIEKIDNCFIQNFSKPTPSEAKKNLLWCHFLHFVQGTSNKNFSIQHTAYTFLNITSCIF